jgi:hypothetical protein
VWEVKVPQEYHKGTTLFFIKLLQMTSPQHPPQEAQGEDLGWLCALSGGLGLLVGGVPLDTRRAYLKAGTY